MTECINTKPVTCSKGRKVPFAITRHKLFYLRGYCTSYPQISMFCTLSQKYQYLFKKIIYAFYSKLSKELKNRIKSKVGQVVLELLIQTIFKCFDL